MHPPSQTAIRDDAHIIAGLCIALLCKRRSNASCPRSACRTHCRLLGGCTVKTHAVDTGATPIDPVVPQDPSFIPPPSSALHEVPLLPSNSVPTSEEISPSLSQERRLSSHETLHKQAGPSCPPTHPSAQLLQPSVSEEQPLSPQNQLRAPSDDPSLQPSISVDQPLSLHDAPLAEVSLPTQHLAPHEELPLRPSVSETKALSLHDRVLASVSPTSERLSSLPPVPGSSCQPIVTAHNHLPVDPAADVQHTVTVYVWKAVNILSIRLAIH